MRNKQEVQRDADKVTAVVEQGRPPHETARTIGYAIEDLANRYPLPNDRHAFWSMLASLIADPIIEHQEVEEEA